MPVSKCPNCKEDAVVHFSVSGGFMCYKCNKRYTLQELQSNDKYI